MLKLLGKILSLFHLQKTLLWDMDGCIANLYEYQDYMENLGKREFFLNINPYYHTLTALKIFMEKHPDCKIGICSKPMDNEYCVIEKDVWLNMYIPQIDLRIYVPLNENKSEYIKKHCTSKRIYFFDDHTPNLLELQKNANCYKLIKVKNQINCKSGVWKGPILETNDVTADEIVAALEMQVYGKTFK